MMRLVFVLSAEERGLLLLGDPTYDAHYAISSLRAQLAEEDAKVLEHRMSAWSRLLAMFRAVYAGIGHPDLHMPAMGGSLFDPDRFEFLEGRKRGTTWRTEPADPLPIDDRTVLLLLEAIQIFKGRTLSYRALDVEQIGHVYEGLLERTVDHVHGVTLQLKASAKVGTCLSSLRELEQARERGDDALIKLLEDKTERSASAIGNDLPYNTDQSDISELLSSCRGDVELRDRIRPFVRLIETDPWGFPLVHHEGAIVVVHGSDRRETGTHYTPKSLTEKIVKETLDPVVYRGPAEGVPRAEWQLKTPAEILDLKICDPAMGSGAFLVQVCRWLAERLLESWASEEDKGRHIDVEGHVLEDADDVSEPLPRDPEERATLARRMIAEKCLYGVDMNPLAVELAKLSLWLTTLAKGRPFGFLDHNLKSGDSLLGISNLEQLIELDINPKQRGQLRLFGRSLRKSVEEATALRTRLREIPVRDITDVEAMAQLDGQSRRILDLPKLVGDAFVGGVLANKKATDRSARIETIAALSDDAAAENSSAIATLEHIASEDLAVGEPNGRPRRPFHWPLEFPEVFGRENGGFDVFVGNPPFMGGKQIASKLGGAYLNFLDFVRNHVKGSPDLVVFFFLRAASLLRIGGCYGLIGTSGIRHTGNRVVGLDQLHEKGFTIFNAVSALRWPGTANVEVSIVSSASGDWVGPKVLDGKIKPVISTALTSEPTIIPKALKSLTSLRSDGFKFMGEGFVLSRQEKDNLLNTEAKAKEIIFPYFTGDDLASLPDLSRPNEYAIDFGEMTKQEAQYFPETFARIRETVKPIRDAQTGQIHQDCFWKYWDMRPKLRAHQLTGKSYLVCPSTTKYLFFRRQIGRVVLSQKVKVLLVDGFDSFAVVQSTFHNEWVRSTSGTRGGGIVEYSLGKSFGTFAFPDGESDKADKYGRDFYELREEICKERQTGPTDLMNEFHSPGSAEAKISSLRQKLVDLDNYVARLYGWNDLELGHEFHEVPYLPENDRLRFTISEAARLEVLHRLAELNRERFQEEGKKSLHSEVKQTKKKSLVTSGKKQAASAAPTLDLEPPARTTTIEEPRAARSEPPIERLYNWLYNQNGIWVPKNQAASATGIAPEELEKAVSILVADDDLIVRGEGDETLLKVKV